MTRPPFDGVRALELLDTLLVGAAFDLPISVLFSGDGVWQLMPQHTAGTAGIKSIAKQLRALPMYDVERIYVHEPSLSSRRLRPDTLVLPAAPLPSAEVKTLIDQAGVVFSD
ncbi:MAG: DsrE family protein [Pseudomonadota bacterium]